MPPIPTNCWSPSLPRHTSCVKMTSYPNLVIYSCQGTRQPVPSGHPGLPVLDAGSPVSGCSPACAARHSRPALLPASNPWAARTSSDLLGGPVSCRCVGPCLSRIVLWPHVPVGEPVRNSDRQDDDQQPKKYCSEGGDHNYLPSSTRVSPFRVDIPPHGVRRQTLRSSVA